MSKLSGLAAFFLALTCIGVADAAEKYVLIDKEDRLVTQSIFSELRSACPGLYIGQIKGEKEKHVFDTNGKVIPIKVPEGFRLNDLFTGDDDYCVPHDSLPPGCCFDVQKGLQHGISDQNGDFVVQPEYAEIQPIGPSRYLLKSQKIRDGQSLCRFFDAHAKRLSLTDFKTPGFTVYYCNEGLFQFLRTGVIDTDAASLDGTMHFGYCNIDGTVDIPSIFQHVEKFVSGLALVTVAVHRVTGETSVPGHQIDFRNVFIDTRGKFVAPEIEPHSGFNIDGYAIAARTENPKLLGLIDRQFHFVLSPEFESLQFLGKNLYATKKRDDNHFVAIDISGAKVFDLPKGIYQFDINIDFAHAPDDVLLVRIDNGTPRPEGFLASNCLIDRTGKVLIPLGGYVGQPRFSLVDASAGYNSERRDRLMTTTGKMLIAPQRAYFMVTEPNRVIKTLLDDKFEPEDWNVTLKNSSKGNVFANFLKDYNLIGMSQQKLFSLLGNGDKPIGKQLAERTIIPYTITSGDCGNMWGAVEIEFKEHIVKRWRFVALGYKGPWFTQNMIYELESDTSHQHLIPKNK